MSRKRLWLGHICRLILKQRSSYWVSLLSLRFSPNLERGCWHCQKLENTIQENHELRLRQNLALPPLLISIRIGGFVAFESLSVGVAFVRNAVTFGEPHPQIYLLASLTAKRHVLGFRTKKRSSAIGAVVPGLAGCSR